MGISDQDFDSMDPFQRHEEFSVYSALSSGRDRRPSVILILSHATRQPVMTNARNIDFSAVWYDGPFTAINNHLARSMASNPRLGPKRGRRLQDLLTRIHKSNQRVIYLAILAEHGISPLAKVPVIDRHVVLEKGLQAWIDYIRGLKGQVEHAMVFKLDATDIVQRDMLALNVCALLLLG